MQFPAPLPPQVFRLNPKQDKAPVAFPLGLGVSGVHEICEASFGDMSALTGFALAAAKLRRGGLIWISETRLALDHGRLLTTGLAALRQTAPAILAIEARKSADALWAIEEAISSAAAALVIAEVSAIDFTASRRLALAAKRHGVPVILLMPYTRQGATASAARWRVSALPSSANRFDPRAPGHTRWRAVLERARAAPQMSGHTFNIELNDETLSLSLVSGLASDTSSPRTPRPENWHNPQKRRA